MKGSPHKPPVLALPITKGQYALDTDAFKKQIRYVFFQEQEDESNRPVGYWSCSLNDKEQNPSTTDRGCQAVIWVVKLLHSYPEKPVSRLELTMKRSDVSLP